MEAEFARLGTEAVLRRFLAIRSADPLIIPYGGWGSPDDEVPLPSWIFFFENPQEIRASLY
jgi:hypothetical protein